MAMVLRSASIVFSFGIGTRGGARGGTPMVKSQWWSLVCSGRVLSRSGPSQSGHGAELGRGGCARMIVMSRSLGGGRKNKQREDKRENVRPAYPAPAPPPPPPPPSPPSPPATSKPVGTRQDVGVEQSGGAATVPDDVEASDSRLAESQIGKVEFEATRNSSTDSESAEDSRKASELRKARAVSRSQDPALTNDFLKSVIHETKLIEWPAFPRILGTTRVVVAMIVGSFVVLLTVNAVLAATSEYVLNDPGFKSFVRTYLKMAF